MINLNTFLQMLLGTGFTFFMTLKHPHFRRNEDPRQNRRFRSCLLPGRIREARGLVPSDPLHRTERGTGPGALVSAGSGVCIRRFVFVSGG